MLLLTNLVFNLILIHTRMYFNNTERFAQMSRPRPAQRSQLRDIALLVFLATIGTSSWAQGSPPTRATQLPLSGQQHGGPSSRLPKNSFSGHEVDETQVSGLDCAVRNRFAKRDTSVTLHQGHYRVTIYIWTINSRCLARTYFSRL